jgi:hypothetical protein
MSREPEVAASSTLPSSAPRVSSVGVATTGALPSSSAGTSGPAVSSTERRLCRTSQRHSAWLSVASAVAASAFSLTGVRLSV